MNGLKTVLSSIEKEPRVKTLVLTSRFGHKELFLFYFCFLKIPSFSYAAVEVGVPDKPRGPLTEDDFNLAASPVWKPYSFSKVETERLAIEWSKTHANVRYASIHPPMIIGPQLNGEALQISRYVR